MTTLTTPTIPESEVPTWATDHAINFAHAPADLKAYAKEVLHMTPRQYAARGTGDEREFYVWNTRRSAHVLDTELSYYWQYR